MFNDLKEILKKWDFIFEMELKNIPQSDCSISSIIVSDFHLIKEKIYGILKKNMPTSVNSIYFASDSQLYLIQTEANTSIEGNVNVGMIFNSRLDNKVEGTFETLSSILSYTKEYSDFTSFFSANSNRKKIDLFIITDISDHHYLRITFEKLDKRKMSHPFIREMALMPCTVFEKLYKS